MAPSEPAMCGSATLAMEESSTSMKVASVTVSATIQGLCDGFQFREEWIAERPTLIPDAHVWLNRHAGAQAIQAGLIGLEAHAHRNALHHFDVVAGGVFGR